MTTHVYRIPAETVPHPHFPSGTLRQPRFIGSLKREEDSYSVSARGDYFEVTVSGSVVTLVALESCPGVERVA